MKMNFINCYVLQKKNQNVVRKPSRYNFGLNYYKT